MGVFWGCCCFLSFWVDCVHACLRSNPPPRQAPHSNKLSQRRHSLHKDDLDKPADCSIQGITGSRSHIRHWGGAHCSLFSAFTTDPGEGAANCSSADLRWPPLSLRSSGWSSLQPSPKVWRRAKQHGTTERQCFPKKRLTFWWIDTFLSLVKVQELPLLLKNHWIVCHNMMACSVWNTHR